MKDKLIIRLKDLPYIIFIDIPLLIFGLIIYYLTKLFEFIGNIKILEIKEK